MTDKGVCHNRFIWNPSIYEYECKKSCDVGEYLDYENYKCRKRLIDNIVEECSEDINGNETVYNVTFKRSWKSIQILHNTQSIINQNFHNNYGHWQCVRLFSLAHNKKLF